MSEELRALTPVELASRWRLLLLDASAHEEIVGHMVDAMTVGMSGASEDEITAFKEVVTQVYREELDFESGVQAAADAAANIFTEDELVTLIEFHESPLGRKVLANEKVLRLVAKQTVEAMTERRMPKIRQRLEQLLEERLEAPKVPARRESA